MVRFLQVSRAGVSMAAAGMSVELLASVLQHPKLGLAPARIGEVDDTASVLGAAPHQIRAFISRFHQVCNPNQRSWSKKVLAFSFLPTPQKMLHFSCVLRSKARRTPQCLPSYPVGPLWADVKQNRRKSTNENPLKQAGLWCTEGYLNASVLPLWKLCH